MWSEIIQSRWVLPATHWNRCLPQFSAAKYIIALSIAAYIACQLSTIGGLLFSSELHHPDLFNASVLNKTTTLLECLLILVQITTWLWVGLSLYFYVVGVRFDRAEQQRILQRLNVVLVIITICYCIRAFLVLILSTEKYGHEAVMKNYLFWLSCTRWLPYILSSLLLILLMRRKPPSARTKNYHHLANPSNVPYADSVDLHNSLVWNNIEETLECDDVDDDDDDVIDDDSLDHCNIQAGGGFFRGLWGRVSSVGSGSVEPVEGADFPNSLSIREIRNGMAGTSQMATGSSGYVSSHEGASVVLSSSTSTSRTTGTFADRAISNVAERNHSIPCSNKTVFDSAQQYSTGTRVPINHGSYNSTRLQESLGIKGAPVSSGARGTSPDPLVVPLNEWTLQQLTTGPPKRNSVGNVYLECGDQFEDDCGDNGNSVSSDKLLSFLVDEYDISAI
jgi:hypothetical protein